MAVSTVMTMSKYTTGFIKKFKGKIMRINFKYIQAVCAYKG
jgi:hypothetical protein